MDKENFIFKYSTEDAENDGVLFNVIQVNPDWEKGIFSHITSNLLSYGYEENGIVNPRNLIDLLNQCSNLVYKLSNEYKEYSPNFEGEIEFSDGISRKILICENELGKFTIMLPEDY